MLKPTDLVLVCLLPTPRYLEIARLLGWCRIPLCTAPKIVAVDQLAFYPPSAFGNRGGQIEFISQVHGHELTPRGELMKDELNHPRANDVYYKIQIGALERLKEPVKSEKWKRLTFLYITGKYFLKAKSLDDLVVNGDKGQLLRRSLREC